MPVARGLNRRQFIGTLGAGVVAAGCASDGLDPFLPGGGPDLAGGTDPSGGSPEDGQGASTDPLKTFLLGRMTFGPTRAESARFDELGHSGFMEEQLDPESIDDTEADLAIAPLWALFATDEAILTVNSQVVVDQLIKGTVLRATLSRRQLYERMVEFWSDHFSIYNLDGMLRYSKMLDDREVIRPHALGNFRTLLRASAQSPAMLVYLNNDLNVKDAINENYARELLELHTVGVDGGYTQVDVEELARVLTGWSWQYFSLRFKYLPIRHDTGAKQVMGLSLPAGGGMEEGEAVLDFLARHSKTAQFLATKLVRRFIAEDAPQAAVDIVAAAYTASDCDIKSTLRALFSRDVIAYAKPRLKRPFHLLVGALRQSSATINIDQDFAAPLLDMGQMPFQWPDPNGYPDNTGHWVGGLLYRWNLGTKLAASELSGLSLPTETTSPKGAIGTIQETIDAWNAGFFGGNMPAPELQALATYLDAVAGHLNAVNSRTESFGLMLGLPAYQLH